MATIFQKHFLQTPEIDEHGVPLPSDPWVVEMSVGADVFKVDYWNANGLSYLWAIEDPNADTELRYFWSAGPGGDTPEGGTLIGMFNDAAQNAWAVFDIPAPV